jgi:triacylglycerol lipase
MKTTTCSLVLVCCGWAVGCSGGMVGPDDGTQGGALTPAATPGQTATQYPIVLIPGLLGFRSVLGSVDYFTAIPEALEEGGAKVFVVDVSLTATPQTRAAQIIPQLEALRASTGATRFNLIGHSQGAMDARLIAATRPDLVASVTSISGPHRGSPAASLALAFPLGLGTIGFQAISDFMKLVSGSSDPNDAKAALEALTPEGAKAFAAMYPAAMPATPCGQGAPVVDGIHYYSWGGIGVATNPLDILDAMWIALSTSDLAEQNDGLVPRCGTHLGLVIRDDYMANHTDETNLVFGLVSPFAPNPKTLYRNQANRLKNVGL